MTTVFTLNVKVADKELKLIKQGQHNLCLTRSVKTGPEEKKGNVVFSMIPFAELASNVKLEWSEEYQVFASHEFKAGAKVTASSDPKTIVGGQTAKIDKDSLVTINGPQKPGQPFTVQNEWKSSANIGVKNRDALTGTFTTIYVSLPTLLHQETDLLPVQKYSVFWDRQLVTNTMFEQSHTPPFDFDLTGQTEITLKFAEDEWQLV